MQRKEYFYLSYDRITNAYCEKKIFQTWYDIILIESIFQQLFNYFSSAFLLLCI